MLTTAGAALFTGLAAAGVVVSRAGDDSGSEARPAATATAAPPPASGGPATGPLNAVPARTIVLPVPEYTIVQGLSDDGGRLVTSAEGLPEVGGTVVTVYDTTTGNQVAEVINRPNTGLIMNLAVNPNNTTVAMATYGYLLLWDITSPDPPRELAVVSDYGGQAFLGVAFLGGGGSLATVVTDYESNHQLLTFDLGSGRRTATRSPDPGATVNAMVIDPDGTRLAVAMASEVVVWDLDTMTPVVVPAPEPAGGRWFDGGLGWTAPTQLVGCVTGADDELRGHALVTVDLERRTTSPAPDGPTGIGGCAVSTGPVRVAAFETGSKPAALVVRDGPTAAILTQVPTAGGGPTVHGTAGNDTSGNGTAGGGTAGDGTPRVGQSAGGLAVTPRPYLNADGGVLAVHDGAEVRIWTLRTGS